MLTPKKIHGHNSGVHARDAFHLGGPEPVGGGSLDDFFDAKPGKDGHSWQLTRKKQDTFGGQKKEMHPRQSVEARSAFHLGGPEPIPTEDGWEMPAKIQLPKGFPHSEFAKLGGEEKKRSIEARSAFHLGGPEPLPVGGPSLDDLFTSKPSKNGNSWQLTRKPKAITGHGKKVEARDAFHLGGPEPIPTKNGWEMPTRLHLPKGFPESSFKKLGAKEKKISPQRRHEGHDDDDEHKSNFATEPHSPGTFGPNDPGFWGP